MANSNPTTPTKNKTSKTNPGETSPTVVGGFGSSPVSTLSSSHSTHNHPGPSPSTFRSMFASLSSAVTSAPGSAAYSQLPRQLTVRADPSLLTCFDPADKELYDLWAPKRR